MDKAGGSRKPKVTVPKRKVITDYYSTSRPSLDASASRRRSASNSFNRSSPSPKANIYGRGAKSLKFGRAAFQIRSANVITNVYSNLVKNGVLPMFVKLYTEKWHRERLEVMDEESLSDASDSDESD